jgi:glycosyltransferase involved in cell wall biosynthesis
MQNPPTVTPAGAPEITGPIRVLIVGFAYIIGVYQSKLKAIQETGAIDVLWLAPTKWKMRSWNRTIPLEVRFKEVHAYPTNIWFLNGINGGYLYPPFSLLNAIREFRPDVLHYEQEVFSLSAFQAALCARILRIPFTAFCWENVEKPLSFYRRWTARFVLNEASAILAGNSGAAQIIRNWGYKRRIFIMPQIGVDTNLFFPRPIKRNDNVFTLGYIGRLVSEKGVDLLFDAAQQLIASGSNLRIIICGGGPHEAELKSYAEQLNIGDRVSWLGATRHDDIPEVLMQTDVVILPSRTLPGKWKEQFGHVLIEAMAMGVPVIGSDSGAIPEVIGRSDLVFPENSAEGLLRIIHRLISDNGWRLEVSEYLRDRAIREYSDSKIAGLLKSIWLEIAESKRR